MIKLPLMVRSFGGTRKAIIDANGKEVSLEKLVGIIGALSMVLNAAKRANKTMHQLNYAIAAAETILYGKTPVDDEQRLDEEELG